MAVAQRYARGDCVSFPDPPFGAPGRTRTCDPRLRSSAKGGNRGSAKPLPLILLPLCQTPDHPRLPRAATHDRDRDDYDGHPDRDPRRSSNGPASTTCRTSTSRSISPMHASSTRSPTDAGTTSMSRWSLYITAARTGLRRHVLASVATADRFHRHRRRLSAGNRTYRIAYPAALVRPSLSPGEPRPFVAQGGRGGGHSLHTVSTPCASAALHHRAVDARLVSQHRSCVNAPAR